MNRIISGWCTGLLLAVLLQSAHAAPGYFPGSYYAAHVIRQGGEMVATDRTESGFQWENYSVQRIKGNRVPARPGHGLEVYADIYGMPVGEQVELRVVRPVMDARGERSAHIMKRSQPLHETDSNEVQVFNYIYFLDEPAEMVTGKWIIELTHRDTLILRQTFDVVPDPGKP
jgi:hypothetical protein